MALISAITTCKGRLAHLTQSLPAGAFSTPSSSSIRSGTNALVNSEK